MWKVILSGFLLLLFIDEDLALMKDKPKLLNFNLQASHTAEPLFSRKQRSIATTINNKLDDTIVGKRAPLLPIAPLHAAKHPVTPENARRLLNDVRQRLRNLAAHQPGSRGAEIQTDAIRNTLKQLSQGILVHNPEQRAKAAANRVKVNLERKARRKLKRVNKPLLHPIVGAVSEGGTTIVPKESENGTNKKESNRRVKPVITQPKELINKS